MNEQTEKLVRELADKLGTTADHLWGVLIKQAPVSAVTSLLGGVAIFALLVYAWRFRAKKMAAETNKNYGDWAGDSPISVISGMLLCIATFALVLAAAGELPLVLAGFFNPEYWALKQIL